MHNNIMAAGYIDTKANGEYLRKCILGGLYKLTMVVIEALAATENSPAVPKHKEVKTVHNMYAENKPYFHAKKEAIFLLLTGIGFEIYSTIDACKTANKMWIAIERLQQGESLNIQDVKTNMFWEFGKFTSHDGESMESYYSRFYKMMNELTRNNLHVTTMQVNVQFLQQLQPEWSRFVTIVNQAEDIDIVSYHKLFDILKQYQKEVNEIRAERIAKSANPLALITAAQPYQENYHQAPKHQRSYAQPQKQSFSTGSSTSIRHKGKEIAKPVTPPSEPDSNEDSDPEQAQKDKEMQKNLALIAKYFKKLYKPTNNNLRTSSNSKNKTEDTSPRYKNDNQSGQFGNQRTMTVDRARETVGSRVVQKNGIQCFNCKEYRHFARECRKPKRVKDYSYHKEKMLMCKQAKKGVPLQAEQADWLADMDEEIDEQELEARYSFMANIQEVLPVESSSTDTPLEQVQYDDEYNVFANEIQHSKQPESINDIYVLEKDDINVTPNSSNICLPKEKTKVISDLKVKEGKDIDKMIEMDKQIKFLNEILYKRNQSIQTIHMLAPKCATYNGRSTFVNPKYLKIAQSKKPCLYEIPYDTSDPANRFSPNREETVTLKNESRSKLNKDTVKPYDYTKQNSFYEIFKPPSQAYLDQLERAKEVRKTMWRKTFVRTKPNIAKNVAFLPVSKSISKKMHEDLEYVKSLEKEIDELECEKDDFSNIYDLLLEEFCKENASNVFQKEREQYHEIQDLKAKLQDKNIAISELKKLIDNFKGKSMETLLNKPSVVRQPNAQWIPKPLVLGKPTPFSNSHEMRRMYRIATSTTQTRTPQLPRTSRNTNPHVSTSTGGSEVEGHHRISSNSKKTKSVTACNNSLNSRTTNVNAVCADYGQCVFNSNHNACVSRYLNDVNARTKKPNVVPISASKPKRKANKSVATPHKKTVASDTIIQKFKSYYKKLYENTNESWKWWIAKKCPTGYKWTQKPPKTKQIWIPKIRKDDVSTSISPTIDIIVQLILFIVNSGCTKHMTGNLKLLCNFVERFLGTVRFGNEQFTLILGYEDLIQGNVTIKRVYYVECLNHNLFLVGQFCNADLEVAFRKSTCYVRDLQGNNLLMSNRGSNLYTISLQKTTSSTLICFMAKASPTQAWLWHRRLSHLNFDYINLLSKKDVVNGLPMLKYVKDQLCSSFEMSKAKRSSFKSKAVQSSKGRLNLLHMDLCGPMRVASINRKKYILVIVDDYSRYTWTLFL
ncbi:retrovirus-related pol polyprotein from transposon TNT 1-94 [Tanacetum coccineum]